MAMGDVICGKVLALGQFKMIGCPERGARDDVGWFDHTEVLKCHISFLHRSFGFGRDHHRGFWSI